MEPLAMLSAGSNIIGNLGKMFGSKMKSSSATSGAYAVGGSFGGGDWSVATSGARAGQFPIELIVAAGLVALLIWKKAK